MKIRYIKDYLRGHTNNSMNSDWTEIKAIDYKGNNIALGKNVTASSTPSWGTLDRVTDGVIEGDVSIGIASSEKQWVQVDLGDIYNIDYLHIWHYFVSSRTFNDTKVEVSENGIDWVVIFDSATSGTYDETSEGRKFVLPYVSDLDKLSETSTLSQINSKVSNIKDEISIAKNTLKTNLIAKGVECSNTDKMSSLIGKVDKIKSYKIIEGDNCEVFSSSEVYYSRDYAQKNATIFTNNITDFSACKLSFSMQGSSAYYMRCTISHKRGNEVIQEKNYQTSGTTAGTLELTDFKVGDIINLFLNTTVTSGSYSTTLRVQDFKLMCGVELQ